MGEKNRTATARAILQQETAQAMTAALDAKGAQLCIEDAAIAIALNLGAFVAINGVDEDLRRLLFAKVFATAQKACEIGVNAQIGAKARAKMEARAAAPSAGDT